MKGKAICVVGYGEVPGDKVDDVRRELRREVQAALDDGYRTFKAEFKGVGILFAQCVSEQREQCADIFIEVVLPHPKQRNQLTSEEQELLSTCNGFYLLPEEYQEDYPLAVTRRLTGKSERVIVIHINPLDRNTAYATDYTLAMGWDLRILEI